MEPGTQLGPYEILSRLGQGGMGVVYRARDTRLDREVAVKVLPRNLAGDPDALGRFEREAKALASLNHPNIATLYGLESVITQSAAGTAAPQDSQASPEAIVAHASRVHAADSESLSDVESSPRAPSLEPQNGAVGCRVSHWRFVAITIRVFRTVGSN